MGKRLDRTVFNWRWWVLLPAMPLIFLGIILTIAGEASELAIDKAMSWARLP